MARLLLLLALAAVFTLLNAVKPLHVDDAIYHDYAAHVAREPLAPYGFKVVYGGPHAWPANEVLAPPVFLYWWAGSIRLLGQHPFLWKLALFPISLLLVVSLHALLRRFARGVEQCLLWMTVLSPALLPSFNLMLDIPALSLGLAALVLFMRACRRESSWQAVAAGLVAGLAMETKYTAFTAPAAILVYAFLWRRPRLGVLAAIVAIAVFASWEGLLACCQGQSHFLLHARAQNAHLLHKAGRLFFPLLLLSGGLGSAFTLLGLIALGSRLWVILLAAAAMIAGNLLALLPSQPVFLGALSMRLNHAACGVLGSLLLVVLGSVIMRLLRRRQGKDVAWAPRAILNWLRQPCRRVDVFLVAWLLVELGGYFVLSPYPAARRLLGPFLVASLLCGRLAAMTLRVSPRLILIRGAALAGIALGLFYQAVDCLDAQGAMQAALAARQQTCGRGSAWYIGNWGFRFYAEQAGFRPLTKDHSWLRDGDWLVVSVDQLLPEACFDADRWPLQAVGVLSLTDGLPLRTLMCYYGGPVPLEHLPGARSQVLIYRVTRDFAFR